MSLINFQRKKIMFYDSADRQTKLRIRCDFDGVTQSQFFRMMLTGYIENDEHVLTYLKKCKESKITSCYVHYSSKVGFGQ